MNNRMRKENAFLDISKFVYLGESGIEFTFYHKENLSDINIIRLNHPKYTYISSIPPLKIKKTLN